MTNLKIAKMCGCAKRAKISENQSFDNMEIALEKANELAEEMNETFCKRHNFKVVDNSGELVIEVSDNK